MKSEKCNSEQCCCKCKHQLEITKHPMNRGVFKGSILDSFGWVCTNPEMLPQATFYDHKHGMCEVFEPKAVNKSDNQTH